MNLPGFNAESSLGPSAGAYLGRNMSGRSPTTGVVTPALPRARSCTTKYGAWISHHFPQTVCKPLFDPGGSVATQAADAPSNPDRSFKPRAVTSRTSRFNPLQDCRVIYAPFVADVTVTQDCDTRLPDSSELVVQGHPELNTSWIGGINEMPPQFNRNWFTFTGQSCSCCGGLTDCFDGRCLPRGVSCDVRPA